jgi:hypothetical protein
MSGRSRPRILVVGHSHLHALRLALRRRPAGPAEIELLRPLSDKGEGTVGDLPLEEIEARAAALGPTDLLALCLRGNQYNTIGLMQHPRAFDLALEGHSLGEAELIPVAAMRDFFASTLEAGYGQLYARLARAGGAPVACLEVPAPKEDAEHIRRGAETFFRDRGIGEIGVTPAPVRLKLWTLQQEALAALCGRLGIAYLPSAAGTRDAAGFLRREFYAADATHANGAYGELVLRQIEAQAAIHEAAPLQAAS